jgi:hypothetical protein
MLEMPSIATHEFLASVHKVPTPAMKSFYGNKVNLKAETPVSSKWSPRIFKENVQA